MNVSRAFRLRLIELDIGDYDLLGIHWNGIYLDTCLLFGTRHSSQIFQRLSEALGWTDDRLIDYINDYIASNVLHSLFAIMNDFCLTLSEKKLVEPNSPLVCLGILIYLFGVLCGFQHCTGHITMGSWKGRGNQYIQFVRVLYCKLPTNGKQLPAFPLEAIPGIEPWPQRLEARVLPLCHHGPLRDLD